MRTRQSGFTLIEVLIVITVIAILAAIVIPNLLLMIQRAKQKRGMAEIRGMATATAAYETDTNFAPVGNGAWQDTTVAIPSGTLDPFYISVMPNPDPWNDNYQYSATATGTDFGYRCLGKDGVADSADLSTLINALTVQTVCFENDIVWVNSDFQIWPERKQVRCL